MGFGGRPFVSIGIILLLAGSVFILMGLLGVGKLAGDFVFKRAGVTFYFPLLSSIIVSIVLTLFLNFFIRK